MFYCDPCKDEKGYPESFSKSSGKCEICDQIAVCNDVPSSRLPAPKIVQMIKVGDMVINADELLTKKLFNTLAKEDPKMLASWLIELTIKHEDLHDMNDEKHSTIMGKLKSVGGVMVDA